MSEDNKDLERLQRQTVDVATRTAPTGIEAEAASLSASTRAAAAEAKEGARTLAEQVCLALISFFLRIS